MTNNEEWKEGYLAALKDVMCEFCCAGVWKTSTIRGRILKLRENLQEENNV